jgi:hypothetical protein
MREFTRNCPLTLSLRNSSATSGSGSSKVLSKRDIKACTIFLNLSPHASGQSATLIGKTDTLHAGLLNSANSNLLKVSINLPKEQAMDRQTARHGKRFLND